MPIADMIVEMRRLGQKTGAGWFRYENGDRTPHPDPALAHKITEKAPELGIPQRQFSDEEILRRCSSPRSRRPARSSTKAGPTAPVTST
jgi:3-hydroxyacyl-CoA dehydrogenase